MDHTFNFDDYRDHDLYHIRYGRGAVIVAIPGIDEESFSKKSDKSNSDKNVAKVFHELVGARTRGPAPIFSKVLSIAEKEKHVYVTLRFEQKTIFAPVVCRPIDVTIERVIPSRSVTFEVIKENNSDRPR